MKNYWKHLRTEADRVIRTSSRIRNFADTVVNMIMALAILFALFSAVFLIESHAKLNLERLPWFIRHSVLIDAIALLLCLTVTLPWNNYLKRIKADEKAAAKSKK